MYCNKPSAMHMLPFIRLILTSPQKWTPLLSVPEPSTDTHIEVSCVGLQVEEIFMRDEYLCTIVSQDTLFEKKLSATSCELFYSQPSFY